MCYNKTQWVKNETVVSATNMNKIEDELERLSIEGVELGSQLEQSKNKINTYTFKMFNLGEVETNDYSDIINSKIQEGYNIIIPIGVYKISKPILWDGVCNIEGQSQSLSVLTVNENFVGDAMFIVDDTKVKKKLGSMNNFMIDCNFIGNGGVWIKKSECITINDITIKHFKNIGLRVGDGVNTVNGSFFNNLKISGDMTYSKPLTEYPNYCILQESKSMDNNYTNIFAWNSKQSIICDKGGSSRFSSVHVWGDLPSNFPQYCYELNGIGSVFNNCKADSPQIAGFKISNHQNIVIGCEILIANSDDNKIDACYIEISNNNNSGLQIVNNKGLYGSKIPNKDLLLKCDILSNSVIFSKNSFSSGWRYASYYDTYYNSIGLNSSRIDITFPKPLQNNQYSIFAQGIWDCGICTITNKTNEGFTINFENKNVENSTFLYTLHKRT